MNRALGDLFTRLKLKQMHFFIILLLIFCIDVIVTFLDLTFFLFSFFWPRTERF